MKSTSSPSLVSSSQAGHNDAAMPADQTVAQPIDWPELGAAHGKSAKPETAPPAVLRDNAHAAAIAGDTHPLHQVRTSLQVCVGSIQLTVGELLAARAGDVLALDRSIDQEVDLLLDGQLVARGHLVAVDYFFAVRISEVPQQSAHTTNP